MLVHLLISIAIRKGGPMFFTLLHETVGSVIHQQRMISVKNLLLILETDITQMQEILQEYEAKQEIRINHAKKSSSGCSPWNSYQNISNSTISENDIIISLMFARTKEFAND
jgi:hypothetical protein